VSVALPKAIQDQVDQVEAMEKEMAAQALQQEQEQTEPEAKPVLTLVPTTPETEQANSAPPQEAPVDDIDWRRRFETLQGKYNAETPRLYEQLRAQERYAAQLKDELERARSIAQAAEAVRAEVTDEDETAFGSDLIDLARRVAREEYQRQYNGVRVEIDRELTPLREQVGTLAQSQIASADDKYWQALGDAVPDWEAVNTDHGWLEWLAEYDPVAGRTRQQGLDEASQRMDVARTAAFFQMWKSSKPQTPAPSPTDQAQQELARQIAPSKSKSGSSAPAGERIWSRADYEAAYDHRNFIGKPDEATRAQSEADRAVQEGRIRW